MLPPVPGDDMFGDIIIDARNIFARRAEGVADHQRMLRVRRAVVIRARAGFQQSGVVANDPEPAAA